MTTPDTRLIRWIQVGVTRVRIVRDDRGQHDPPGRRPEQDADHDQHRITGRAAVTPSPANNAPNDRIVIGLASVSPRIDRYAPGISAAPVVTVAASVGTERMVRQASHSRKTPADEPEHLTGVDQHVRDRAQAEGRDRPVRRVRGRHAEAGDQPVQLALGERPADDQQADRADGGGDREAEDEAAERERGIHESSFRWVVTRKTPSASAGASLGTGGRRPLGRTASGRGGPGGPLLASSCVAGRGGHVAGRVRDGWRRVNGSVNVAAYDASPRPIPLAMTNAPPAPLKVGIQLPEVEREVRWTEILDMTRAIEDLGFDSVWVGEHLLYRWQDRPAARSVGGVDAPRRDRRDDDRGSSSARSSPARTSTTRRCSPSRPPRSTRSAAAGSSSAWAPAGTRRSSAPSASRSTTGSTGSRRRSRSSGRSSARAPSTSTGAGTRPATASCCRAGRARAARR